MTKFAISAALLAAGGLFVVGGIYRIRNPEWRDRESPWHDLLKMTAADPPRHGFLWNRHFGAPEPFRARVHIAGGVLMIVCGLLILIPR